MPRSNLPALMPPDPASAMLCAPELTHILANCQRYLPQRSVEQTISMTLIARQRLGASDERLNEYFRSIEPQLQPLPSQMAPHITAENWQEFLGQEVEFPAFLHFFAEEMAASDRMQVLRRYLPDLLPGMAAAGLLPLMRLAFAIEAKEDGEVVAALAWWASDFAVIPLPDSAMPQAYANVKLAMPALASIGVDISPLPLGQALQQVGQIPVFSEVVGSTKVVSRNNESLRALSLIAVQLYWQTQHPLVLQMLLACYALRQVMPYVPEHRMLAVRHFWSAYAALFVVSAINVAPEQLMQVPGSYMSWIEIAHLAAISHDPHLVALIYVCREEYGHAPNLVYWRVAQRALGWQDPTEQAAFPTL